MKHPVWQSRHDLAVWCGGIPGVSMQLMRQEGRAVRRLSGDRRAAAAMEFALVLPLFLLMMCGTLQYGILFYTWNVALNGARNAARALAVGRVDEAGAEAMMIDALPPWVQAGGSSADDEGDRDCGGGNGDPDDTGGYGPGGCGAGNGDDDDDDDGDAGGDAGGGGDISAVATDAEVGDEVSATLVFPSERATFLPLAPMPDNVSVAVQMVKEA
jgi:hypothetical protein